MYIAHRAGDGRVQSIPEHAKNVSELCAGFAALFGAEELGRLLGLAHDIGKYSRAFQRKSMGEIIKAYHSDAGAQEMRLYDGLLDQNAVLVPGGRGFPGHRGLHAGEPAA